MDYKEKYEKVLENAKEFLKRWECVEEANSSLVLKEVKDIFPELKEDERIRNNCIHFLELQKKHHAATFEIEECIDWLETLKEKQFVYVVTRSEEHSDYVEKVFFDEERAEAYCKQFNENEDSYHRDITKVKTE